MKTLLLYASKHGGCEEVSKQLITNSTTCCDIHSFTGALDTYDQIVLGSSVYASCMDKTLIAFMKEHLTQLCTKKIYLFLVGIEKDAKKIHVTFSANVPSALLEQATYIGCLGGYINFESMNFFEKMIIKGINKKAHFYTPSKSITYIDLTDQEAINTLKSYLK